MINIKKIADDADMIINGYAYTKDGNNVKVLNLNNTESALVVTLDGVVIESNMCEIETAIALDYFKQNRKYMEV